MAGRRTPSIPVATNIARALGIGLEELIEGLSHQTPIKKRKPLGPKVKEAA
jgi:hypothetical protein